MSELWKRPRLYMPVPLSIGTQVSLGGVQHHYVRNVMRMTVGDTIRLFNEAEGEFLGSFTEISKKSSTVQLSAQLREAPSKSVALSLYFAPLKKERMDWVIQKAVELGVQDIYPVMTEYAEYRPLKTERLEAQIIESSEQCERLNIPKLHGPQELENAVNDSRSPVFAAIERCEGAQPLLSAMHAEEEAHSFLIGPAGGFSQTEKQFLLSCDSVIPVALGTSILRAETAVTYVLSVYDAVKNKT